MLTFFMGHFNTKKLMFSNMKVITQCLHWLLKLYLYFLGACSNSTHSQNSHENGMHYKLNVNDIILLCVS